MRRVGSLDAERVFCRRSLKFVVKASAPRLSAVIWAFVSFSISERLRHFFDTCFLGLAASVVVGRGVSLLSETSAFSGVEVSLLVGFVKVVEVCW